MQSIKNIFYFSIKGLAITMLFFCSINLSYATSVNVGPDDSINYDNGDDYHLSATINGFDTCDFVDYLWQETTETLFINQSYTKDNAVIYSNDINEHPGTYTIKLTTTCNGGNPDDGGFEEEDSFVLTINGPASNQAPTNISLDNNNIDENNSIGNLIGNLSTTDPDDPDNLGNYTYSLISESGNQSNSFIIDGNKLKINEIADYETRSSYLVKILTTDDGGLSYTKEFTININDINETVASIDAGTNQDVNIGDTVYLNGSINGFPSSGCDFQYNWFDDSERVTIINSGSLTGASFETSNFNGTINLKIGLKVIVSSSEMTHDSCGKTGIYNDITTININPQSSLPVSHHHGKSYSTKMKEEADKLFKDEKSINKIKISLYNNKSDRYSYNLGWTYIGGKGKINYELLYSTGSAFKSFEKYTTLMTSKQFYYKELDENIDVYFFKVRAIYKDKKSPWSNILSIDNQNNPLKYFKIKCINCNKKIYFGDVFQSVDLLIEDKFKIKCTTCKKRNIFSDIFIYKTTNELIDEKLNNSFCNKKVNFDDIFDYIKTLDLKIKCTNKIKKINFKHLLKNKNLKDNLKVNCRDNGYNKVNFNDVFNYKKGIDFKVECINKFQKINFNSLTK